MLKYGFYFCVLGQIINFSFLVAPSFANRITPYRTLRYEGVVGQTTYYTCGAAAVATLLTHYCQNYFPTGVRYVVTDGFYSKYKWVSGVVQLGLHHWQTTL